MQSVSAIAPESSSIPLPQAMLDRVIIEVFGATKFSKVKAVLDQNKIETLVELACMTVVSLLN
jgi:hypothetical protein